MWLIIGLISLGGEPSAQQIQHDTRSITPITHAKAQISGRPRLAPSRVYQSSHFFVRSNLDQPCARQVAELCESLYGSLRRKWLGDDTATWKRRCEVVLHRNRAGYLRAVGQGGRQTTGSSRIKIERGKVLARRIDLFAEDRDRALATIPHELIHVLFADLFPNAAAPRWAEEGLALLNDTDDKQARHLNDLRYALRTNTILPLERLFTTANYPTGWRRAVFYGQSLSLVDYLAQLDKPKQFVRFVKLCQKVGHDRALKVVYGINGHNDLERRWKKQVAASLDSNS